MIDITKYRNMSEVYFAECLRVISSMERPVVFKTDLWNEACDSPGVGGIAGRLPGVSQVYAIEICPDRVKKAIGNLQAEIDPIKYHFTSGDIRSLPYADGMFDALLDLSTIDHIVPDDMPKTIEGYARVVKPGGVMLIVSWCDDNFKPERIDGYSPTTQYYHSEELMRSELLKWSEIEESMRLITDLKEENKVLIEFVCRKKGL